MHSPLFPDYVFHLHWEKWLGSFLYFLLLSPSFFHSLSSIIPLSFILPLSWPLSFYQLPKLFAIFMRQLFIYVSAQLDFIAYFFFSHSTLETYSADPHAVQHGGDCDAQVTSVLGSITLSTSEPSSSLHHIYQSLIQQIKHIKALKGTSRMAWFDVCFCYKPTKAHIKMLITTKQVQIESVNWKLWKFRDSNDV